MSLNFGTFQQKILRIAFQVKQELQEAGEMQNTEHAGFSSLNKQQWALQ